MQQHIMQPYTFHVKQILHRYKSIHIPKNPTSKNTLNFDSQKSFGDEELGGNFHEGMKKYLNRA